jgi:hypothetical protein
VEQLIEEIRLTQKKLSDLRSQLHKQNDGFLYLTCLRCYGSLNYETYTNKFLVQELCNEYDGWNGIVDVYTTNPNHDIKSYGTVHVKSLKEIKNISKENISMSQAVCNWINGRKFE